MVASYLSRFRWIPAALGLVACAPAHALDMEYYVYNGFDEALGAFQRLALIFSDNNYVTMFTAVAILAIVMAVTTFHVRGLSGGGPVDIRSWAMPIIIGVVVFRALVLPKGTIFLYDPVRNENQAIGGVPDAIVVVAGSLNLLERGLVDIVDTASAYPYASEAGGITFDLIYRATAEWNDVNDFYYTMSLGRYFTDCGLPALASQAYNVNLDQLKRANDDIRTLLEAMASSANFTVYYSTDNKAGVSLTCATDWQVNLSPFLNSPDSFTGMINGICAKAGFNVSSVNQQQRCRTLLARAAETAGAVGSDAVNFVRQAYIADAIDRVMQEKNPDLAQKAIANRNLMIQGIGISNTVNEWIPTIRAVVLAVVLGMIPLVALFLVTPLAGRAILVTVGLLVWFTLWGITDAITHQMALDGAQRAFQRITDFQLGLDSMWLMPEASTKALAYFGKIRGMSFMIATALSGMLLKLGASALSGIAQGLTESATSTAAGAATQTQTETRAQLRHGMVEGSASEMTRASVSMDSWATSNAFSQISSVGSTDAMLRAGAQSGKTMHDLLPIVTAQRGGQELGRIQATMNTTTALGKDGNNPDHVLETSAMVSEVEQTQRMGNAAKTHEAITHLGGGDFTKGAVRYAGIAAMQKYTGLGNVAQLADTARKELEKTTRKPASEADGYRALAQVMMSQTEADIKTFGTPETLANYLMNHRYLEKGRIDGLASVAHKYGYTLEQLGEISGKVDAAQRAGNDRALQALGVDAITAGYEYQAAIQGATGEFWKKWVAKHGGNEAKIFRDVAAYHQEREVARWQTATLVADKMKMSRPDYLLRSEGSNIAITVPDAQAWSGMSKELMRNGLLDEKQDSAIRGMGATGKLTFSYDPVSGKGVQMNFQSGSAVYDGKTITVERKDVFTDEYERNVGLAMLRKGSDAEAEFRKEMPRMLSGQDKQLLERWTTSLAQPFKDITNLSIEDSHIRQWGASGNLGLHTPRISRRIADAGGGISGSVNNQSGENRQYDTARAVTSSLLRASWEEASEEARKQATHDGVLNEKEYVQLRDKLAPEIFLESHRGLYDFVKDKAAREANTSTSIMTRELRGKKEEK